MNSRRGCRRRPPPAETRQISHIHDRIRRAGDARTSYCIRWEVRPGSHRRARASAGSSRMKFEAWLAYTIGAGLCWGTYVPMIAFGGRELKSRYMAFLCVGVAYFLIAVLFPVVRFALGWDKVGDLKTTGLVFATLAGAAGAFGALGVIFATAAADPGDRIYIAPLIFTLAPLLNTVVSLFW